MELPNSTEAVIPREKILEYLLSPVHSVGRHKAAFFRSLGYSPNKWQALAQDLRALAIGDAIPVQETEYGRKYEIRGQLTGPNGRSATVITAWIVLHGEDFARFITAYPEG